RRRRVTRDAGRGADVDYVLAENAGAVTGGAIASAVDAGRGVAGGRVAEFAADAISAGRSSVGYSRDAAAVPRRGGAFGVDCDPIRVRSEGGELISSGAADRYSRAAQIGVPIAGIDDSQLEVEARGAVAARRAGRLLCLRRGERPECAAGDGKGQREALVS